MIGSLMKMMISMILLMMMIMIIIIMMAITNSLSTSSCRDKTLCAHV